MNKKENILNRLCNRLCFSGAYLLVILTIVGVMLSCGSEEAATGGVDPEPTPTVKPNAVTNLVIQGEPRGTEITITWTRPTGTTRYEITKQKENGTVENVDNDLGASDTVFIITFLDPVTSYTFTLKACNDLGCSEPATVSGTTEALPAPAKIADLAIKGDPENTVITITWTRPTEHTYYVVNKQKESEGFVVVDDHDLEASDTELRLENLDPDTSYTFTLQACNAGGCSESATVTGRTKSIKVPPANAPENLAYSPEEGLLQWAAVNAATYFPLYYTNITSGGPEVSNHVVQDNEFATTDLVANTAYSFSVQACNQFGCSSRSEPHSFTTAPPTPKVTAGDPGTRSVTLNWDKIDGAIRYEIYRDDSLIHTIEDDSTTYIVSGLKPEIGYDFYVKACNSEVCSGQSSTVQVTMLALPDFFTIHYPKIDSTADRVTTAPVIVGGKDCDLESVTAEGKATYSISALSDGSRVVPGINSDTGGVDNVLASPGVYRVTVTVTENAKCNTNVMVYHTIKPANKDALKAHIFDGTSSGVALHGNEGNFNYIDTSGITTMTELFYKKTSFNGDITEWDTSKVGSMRDMFGDTEKFDRDISKWDTSQVTAMVTMFAGAKAFYQDLSGWNVDKVTKANGGFMFYQSKMANKKEWWPPKFR